MESLLSNVTWEVHAREVLDVTESREEFIRLMNERLGLLGLKIGKCFKLERKIAFTVVTIATSEQIGGEEMELDE